MWAAKWHGESEILQGSVREPEDRESVMKEVHSLLSEADVVVHYNGTAFDIPTLNREFEKLRLGPPAPFREVDLWKAVAKKFNLASNKLEYVVKYFGIGQKIKTSGMDLWIGCMNGDPKSWRLMEKYNRGDVKITEKLYDHILPWIPNHPNYSMYEGESMLCPNCGSTDVQKRGVERTQTQAYQRYQCNQCGKWSRSGIREKTKIDSLRGIG